MAIKKFDKTISPLHPCQLPHNHVSLSQSLGTLADSFSRTVLASVIICQWTFASLFVSGCTFPLERALVNSEVWIQKKGLHLIIWWNAFLLCSIVRERVLVRLLSWYLLSLFISLSLSLSHSIFLSLFLTRFTLLPLTFFAVVSAPARRSSKTHETCPSFDALCSGVCSNVMSKVIKNRK